MSSAGGCGPGANDAVGFRTTTGLVLQEGKARRAAIQPPLGPNTDLSEQLIALVRENRAALDPALRHLRGVVDVLRAIQSV